MPSQELVYSQPTGPPILTCVPHKTDTSGPPSCCYAKDLSSFLRVITPAALALRPEEDARAYTQVPPRSAEGAVPVPRQVRIGLPAADGLRG